MNSIDKFWARVDKISDPNGCWNWTGYITSRGYGEVGINYKVYKVHRISYVLVKGEIPEGLVLDHLCKNRRCCNPNHLEPVTQRENVNRGNAPSCIARRENRCLKGHKLTPENTYIFNETKRGKKRQSRRCRQCFLGRKTK